MLIDKDGMNWFAAQGSGVTVYSAGSGGGVSGRSPAEQQMVEQDYFYLNWIVNASQSPASVESSYNIWNFLWDVGYGVPVWGDCQSASDDVFRGNYFEAALHFGMGLTIAYGITKSLLQNFSNLFIGATATKTTTTQYTKSSLEFGNKMHKLYKADLHNPAKGLYKEFTGIKGIRPDFVDFNNRIIYELKPNNPRQILQGMRQLNRYKVLFEHHYGGSWNIVLDLY